MACLVNALAPGLVPDFNEMEPESAKDNIERAMEMAKEWMDIPRVIEPDDMMDPNVSSFQTVLILPDCARFAARPPTDNFQG